MSPLVQKREPLSAKLVREIKEKIANGHYGVGDRLPTEQEMVAAFGVSRTVVREAIAHLKTSGLVMTSQGRGAFVVRQERPDTAFRIEDTRLSLVQEIVSIFELRMALEMESAFLAAQRRTDEQLAAIQDAVRKIASAPKIGGTAVADMQFHQSIAAASGNPYFPKLLDYLGDRIFPKTRVAPVQNKKDARREHEQICYAIERSDPEAARYAMRLHLLGSRDRLIKRLENFPFQSRAPKEAG